MALKVPLSTLKVPIGVPPNPKSSDLNARPQASKDVNGQPLSHPQPRNALHHFLTSLLLFCFLGILLGHGSTKSATLPPSLFAILSSGFRRSSRRTRTGPSPTVSLFLHSQASRRARSPHHAGGISRTARSRSGSHVPTRPEFRRHSSRPRHLPLLLHRHSLGSQRASSRPRHPARRPASPHISWLRRKPPARIDALPHRRSRLARGGEPRQAHRHVSCRTRPPVRSHRHR